MSAQDEQNNQEPQQELNIIDVCSEILLALLDNKQPDDVKALLAQKAISAEDADNLINITIGCFQEVSPVVEQRIPLEQAIGNLVKQGMDARLAQNMSQMILSILGERAIEKSGVDMDEAPVINEEQMNILMRLSMAVMADLQKGVPVENIAQAIDNISDIDKLPDVKGRSVEFVDNVRLAHAAASRCKAGMQLPQVIKDLGLDKKQPYVSVLALFFLKLTNSQQNKPAQN